MSWFCWDVFNTKPWWQFQGSNGEPCSTYITSGRLISLFSHQHIPKRQINKKTIKTFIYIIETAMKWAVHHFETAYRCQPALMNHGYYSHHPSLEHKNQSASWACVVLLSAFPSMHLAFQTNVSINMSIKLWCPNMAPTWPCDQVVLDRDSYHGLRIWKMA